MENKNASKIIDEFNYVAPTDRCAICSLLSFERIEDAFGYPCVHGFPRLA